jgi:DNA-binding NtrC family response regulator
MNLVILSVGAQDSNVVVRKWILEADGYTVVTAETPSQALRILHSSSARAAILDYDFLQACCPSLAHEMHRAKPQVPLLLITCGEVDVDPYLRTAVDNVCNGSDVSRLLAALKTTVGSVRVRRGKPPTTASFAPGGYTRSRLGQVIVSVCGRCLKTVGRATTEHAIRAAERAHRCSEGKLRLFA